MNWILANLAAVQLDVVIGIALIMLLFIMLRSEHERCDKVRASWRDVRRQTFAVTIAIQRAKQRREHADGAEYLEAAKEEVNEWYSAVLSRRETARRV